MRTGRTPSDYSHSHSASIYHIQSDAKPTVSWLFVLLDFALDRPHTENAWATVMEIVDFFPSLSRVS